MTEHINERELVLEILLTVTRDGEYSHIALKNVLDKYQYLEKNSRAFITRLSEGTLERMIELDHIIDQFSKVPVRKQKPVIRNILRMGVYQLKYMDTVPASAACNEAVKLAERKGFRSLKGFVNGVLRNISRNMENIKMPKREDGEIPYLSVSYSMPEWIVKVWEKDYGISKTEEMLQALLSEPELSIRVNEGKITPGDLKTRLETEGVTVRQNETLPYAFFISGFDHLRALPSFEEGLFYVQDESSMRVAELAQPEDGNFVIDVCAAPGGKSIHIAEKMHGTGHVEARDLTPYKVGLIEENIRRCETKNMSAVCMDARIKDDASVQKADIVIADLPCSGLGVIQKKKDIKYKMTPEKQKDLAVLQREILSVVHMYTKRGGTLIYSTCTINRAENEENVAWFLREYPEFTLVSMEQILPQAGRCDGFFLAKLKRKNEQKAE